MAISPIYTIHHYREDTFKVVRFKGCRDPDAVYLRNKEDHQVNDNKLANNFSRARSMVLQYALCNPWDYFFTGTLDKAKYDRYNGLDRYMNELSQFVRDKRKAYQARFSVLLIPEHHEDGAWHIHGMIYGLPDRVLRKFRHPEPWKLIKGGFLNWPDYQRKFGFCSLGKIKNPVATAFYVSKYVSKDLSRRAGDKGKHLYFHSRPLRKAEKASDIYLPSMQLDKFCTQDFEFCATGFAYNQPWIFPYVWDGADFPVQHLDNLRDWEREPEPAPDPMADFRPWEIDPFYEQLKIEI